MESTLDRTIKLLDHGYLKLLDVMGSDEDIVYAARISTRGLRSKNDDRRLLDYLIRHDHLSPLEMAELKFEVKAPIFVARQWFRHRTGNYNEISGRYTRLPEDIYIPENLRGQDHVNRQGSVEGTPGDLEHLEEAYREHVVRSRELYERLLEHGVARELARAILPLSQYTVFIYKSDLRNLLHFLKLRLDSHAQYEIRVYAEAIEGIVARLFPLTHEAWRRNVRDGKRLSSLELKALRDSIRIDDLLSRLDELIRDHELSPSLKRELLEKLGVNHDIVL